MSESYFKNFPAILYANTAVCDVTRRVALLDSVSSDPRLFYTRQLSDGQRPDSVADVVYDDPFKEWILFLANQVVDPWLDWHMSDSALSEYVATKYGSVGAAQALVTRWRSDWYADETVLTPGGWSSLDPTVQVYWQQVYDSDGSLSGYSRLPVDWSVSTNAIKTISTQAVLAVGEQALVNPHGSPSYVGQVARVDPGVSISLYHVGSIDPDVVSGTRGQRFVQGLTSGAGDTITASSLDSVSITAVQSPYWTRVTAWDEEVERNDALKTIRILDPRYAQQTAAELKRLINQ